MKLPKELYLKNKALKKQQREATAGKVLRDKSGHLYKVDEHGTVRRLTRDEISIFDKQHPEPPPI